MASLPVVATSHAPVIPQPIPIVADTETETTGGGGGGGGGTGTVQIPVVHVAAGSSMPVPVGPSPSPVVTSPSSSLLLSSSPPPSSTTTTAATPTRSQLSSTSPPPSFRSTKPLKQFADPRVGPTDSSSSPPSVRIVLGRNEKGKGGVVTGVVQQFEAIGVASSDKRLRTTKVLPPPAAVRSPPTHSVTEREQHGGALEDQNKEREYEDDEEAQDWVDEQHRRGQKNTERTLRDCADLATRLKSIRGSLAPSEHALLRSILEDAQESLRSGGPSGSSSGQKDEKDNVEGQDHVDERDEGAERSAGEDEDGQGENEGEGDERDDDKDEEDEDHEEMSEFEEEQMTRMLECLGQDDAKIGKLLADSESCCEHGNGCKIKTLLIAEATRLESISKDKKKEAEEEEEEEEEVKRGPTIPITSAANGNGTMKKKPTNHTTRQLSMRLDGRDEAGETLDNNSDDDIEDYQDEQQQQRLSETDSKKKHKTVTAAPAATPPTPPTAEPEETNRRLNPKKATSVRPLASVPQPQPQPKPRSALKKKSGDEVVLLRATTTKRSDTATAPAATIVPKEEKSRKAAGKGQETKEEKTTGHEKVEGEGEGIEQQQEEPDGDEEKPEASEEKEEEEEELERTIRYRSTAENLIEQMRKIMNKQSGEAGKLFIHGDARMKVSIVVQVSQMLHDLHATGKYHGAVRLRNIDVEAEIKDTRGDDTDFTITWRYDKNLKKPATARSQDNFTTDFVDLAFVAVEMFTRLRREAAKKMNSHQLMDYLNDHVRPSFLRKLIMDVVDKPFFPNFQSFSKFPAVLAARAAAAKAELEAAEAATRKSKLSGKSQRKERTTSRKVMDEKKPSGKEKKKKAVAPEAVAQKKKKTASPTPRGPAPPRRGDRVRAFNSRP